VPKKYYLPQTKELSPRITTVLKEKLPKEIFIGVGDPWNIIRKTWV
jgi:hypothetical protein